MGLTAVQRVWNNKCRPSSYPGCLPSLICCQTFLMASEARIADQLSRKYLTCTYTAWSQCEQW